MNVAPLESSTTTFDIHLVRILGFLKEKLEKSIKQKKGQEEEEEEDMIPQILEVNKNLNDILRTFRDINKDSEK